MLKWIYQLDYIVATHFAWGTFRGQGASIFLVNENNNHLFLRIKPHTHNANSSRSVVCLHEAFYGDKELQQNQIHLF